MSYTGANFKRLELMYTTPIPPVPPRIALPSSAYVLRRRARNPAAPAAAAAAAVAVTAAAAAVPAPATLSDGASTSDTDTCEGELAVPAAATKDAAADVSGAIVPPLELGCATLTYTREPGLPLPLLVLQTHKQSITDPDVTAALGFIAYVLERHEWFTIRYDLRQASVPTRAQIKIGLAWAGEYTPQLDAHLCGIGIVLTSRIIRSVVKFVLSVVKPPVPQNVSSDPESARSFAQSCVGPSHKPAFQIDVGSVVEVSGVRTKKLGGGSHREQCVTQFNVHYSTDNVAWSGAVGNNGTEYDWFDGPTASDGAEDAKDAIFAAPVMARYVRVQVQTYHSWPSMRVGLLVRGEDGEQRVTTYTRSPF